MTTTSDSEGDWRSRPHLLLALILALGCKESAVAAPLGLAGLTAVIHARRVRELPEPAGWHGATWHDRLSWLLGFVLVAVYLMAYRTLGFGVSASSLYADPLSEPAAFLGHLVVQLPILWLASLSPAPPSVAIFWRAAQPVMIVLGVVVFALFLLALRPLRGRPHA